MNDQMPNTANEIARAISTTQAGITLAAALGVTAVGRRAWAWFNRTHDETFLLALATHAASLERADMLHQPPNWADDGTRRELQRIATELTVQANHNVRAAIIQRDWARTRRAGIGPMGFALGALLFLFALARLSTPDASPTWDFGVLAGLGLAAGALIVGAIVRHYWTKKHRLKTDEPNASPGVTSTTAEVTR